MGFLRFQKQSLTTQSEGIVDGFPGRDKLKREWLEFLRRDGGAADAVEGGDEDLARLQGVLERAFG